MNTMIGTYLWDLNKVSAGCNLLEIWQIKGLLWTLSYIWSGEMLRLTDHLDERIEFFLNGIFLI